MMTVFKDFDSSDIVKGNPVEVTTGLWTGGTGSLTAFYTGSQSTGSAGQYYWNVYNINPTASTAEVQFAISYGHRTGGGAPTLNQSDTAVLPTQAVYSQYRTLLLDPGDSQFTFLGSYNSDHIYAINVQRARIKERLDPGNWQLTLSGSSGSFTFVDDSGQSLGSQFGRSGAVFNIVSGSLSGSSGITVAAVSSSTRGGFGLFYPSVGVLILNPDAIQQTVGLPSGSYYTTAAPFAPVTTSQATVQYNHAGLYRSMVLGSRFVARSSEMISSTHFFVRVRNQEFNYTNNPTFFDQTNGAINQETFINDPRVYITTIGLYNDQNELLAVAKTSKPIQKSYANETLLRVRLDW